MLKHSNREATVDAPRSTIFNIASLILKYCLCAFMCVVNLFLGIPFVVIALMGSLLMMCGSAQFGYLLCSFADNIFRQLLNIFHNILGMSCDSPHCGCPPHCGHFPHCGHPPHCGCHGDGDCSLKCVFYLFVSLLILPYCWCVKKPMVFMKSQLKEGEQLRVAYVSVWGIPCGISTYNEELVPYLREHAEVKVFAEYADGEKTERLERDPEWVVRCWSRHEHPKSNLMRALLEYQPHIVHIGHEYGFFARAYMYTSLVTWLRGRNIPVVTTFHSIYDHQDKVVTEASAANIIVHTNAGKNCLLKKGISGPIINLIPHGTEILAGTQESPELLPSLWNTWHTQYTIFHPGFMFSYKGHMRMLDIVAKLKDKYPDVHYIIQGSENPHNMSEHDALYNQIISKAEDLGISSNVTVNRGFVSKEVLLSFIRTTRVCVLPYQGHPDHEVRATSGIARVIAGTETPMVVSSVHLFDDLDQVATKCVDNDAIYQSIDSIFSNNEIKNAQIHSRVKFLKDTGWKTIGKKTMDVYKTMMRH